MPTAEDAAARQPSLLEVTAAEPEARPTPWAGVASVLVDVPLPHLDRPFDYGIPEAMAGEVVPGCRVKVRFAGQERSGYVIGRTRAGTHTGELAPLRRVVSPVAVLTPAVLEAARAIAAHYAGVTTDVLRLAVPPRHAGAERAVLEVEPAPSRFDKPPREGLFAQSEHDDAWADHPAGAAFLRRVATGEAPRAVALALPASEPAQGWPAMIAAAVHACLRSERGALVLLPDARDVATMSAVLTQAGLDHEVLTAEQGRSARYRRFMLALLGRTQIVIGTRSASFTPVRDLGLVVCWDDGDDSYVEQRAPYPHTRQVLVERARIETAAALVLGHARSPAAEQLVADGWARSMVPERAVVRARTPRVSAPTAVDLAREGPGAAARFPRPAAEVTRRALRSGPVLVQVPRAGYVPVVACARCREPARCSHCHGPLALSARDGAPSCRWCGRRATAWSCEACGGTEIRAVRIGTARTAEELGRAFPGVPVVVSGRDGTVVERVEAVPTLVIATPGAEPDAVEGYQAAVLLDGGLMAARADLDASVEALRRWIGAAARVRPEGEVILVGSPPATVAQALVRWDPVGYARRELGEREELRFPPVARLATVTGPDRPLRRFLERLDLPPGAEVLGPQPHPGNGLEDRELARAIVRTPRADGAALGRSLKAGLAIRTAAKEPGTIRIRVDPTDLW